MKINSLFNKLNEILFIYKYHIIFSFAIIIIFLIELLRWTLNMQFIFLLQLAILTYIYVNFKILSSFTSKLSNIQKPNNSDLIDSLLTITQLQKIINNYIENYTGPANKIYYIINLNTINNQIVFAIAFEIEDISDKDHENNNLISELLKESLHKAMVALPYYKSDRQFSISLTTSIILGKNYTDNINKLKSAMHDCIKEKNNLEHLMEISSNF